MRLDDLQGLTEDQIEDRMHDLVGTSADSRADIDARIHGYEVQYRMSTRQLRERLKSGELTETAKICDWLILADLQDELVS